MKKKILKWMLVVTGIGLIILFFSNMKSGLEPEYEHAEIKQNVGGVLIVDSIYNADFHSWEYDVTYKYKAPDGKTYDIGNGRYSECYWDKNAQFTKYNNLLILKTYNFRYDKIIVGNPNSGIWKSYGFDPYKIEKEPLWINQNLNSSPNNFDSTTTIRDITSDGKVTILYNYAIKNRIFNWKSGQRLITYQLDSITGAPIITAVLKP